MGNPAIISINDKYANHPIYLVELRKSKWVPCFGGNTHHRHSVGTAIVLVLWRGCAATFVPRSRHVRLVQTLYVDHFLSLRRVCTSVEPLMRCYPVFWLHVLSASHGEAKRDTTPERILFWSPMGCIVGYVLIMQTTPHGMHLDLASYRTMTHPPKNDAASMTMTMTVAPITAHVSWRRHQTSDFSIWPSAIL